MAHTDRFLQSVFSGGADRQKFIRHRNFDGCNVMDAEGWVTTNKRISAVFGSNVTRSSSPCKGHIVDCYEHFCLSMRRFIPEICGIECESQEKMVQNLMFFAS